MYEVQYHETQGTFQVYQGGVALPWATFATAAAAWTYVAAADPAAMAQAGDEQEQAWHYEEDRAYEGDARQEARWSHQH